MDDSLSYILQFSGKFNKYCSKTDFLLPRCPHILEVNLSEHLYSKIILYLLWYFQDDAHINEAI